MLPDLEDVLDSTDWSRDDLQPDLEDILDALDCSCVNLTLDLNEDLDDDSFPTEYTELILFGLDPELRVV